MRSAADTLVEVKDDLAHLLELPASERLRLVEALWDSLIEFPDAVTVPDELRAELDRRLAAYYDDPSSARPWTAIRDEIFGTK